jgi:hypothetical protein
MFELKQEPVFGARRSVQISPQGHWKEVHTVDPGTRTRTYFRFGFLGRVHTNGELRR